MKVGDKVVCLWDFKGCGFGTEMLPIKGQIYTIREFTNYSKLCIRLVEIMNPPNTYSDRFGEPTFDIKEFRPVDYSFGEKIAEEICKTSEPEKQPAYANN